ncbi:MAG TPA: hypothetical protein VEV18_03435 [Steroidobacteraceae bacterium]|nr:hypothetical protein [Steroidobacteraceae bacterium]
MKTILRAAAAAAASCLVSFIALAQAPPGVARGTIEALNGDTLTLKTEAGGTETIQLAPKWTVTVLKPVGPDAIKPGSFIGTAEMPQANGTGRSLEVHVFPPGVKAGEGHYPWDLRKGSMMTNGTVGQVKSVGKGREITVTYPQGERHITVPKNVPVVEFTNGDRSLVKPGIAAFLIVVKSPDGALSSMGVAIGENGAKPPM